VDTPLPPLPVHVEDSGWNGFTAGWPLSNVEDNVFGWFSRWNTPPALPAWSHVERMGWDGSSGTTPALTAWLAVHVKTAGFGWFPVEHAAACLGPAVNTGFEVFQVEHDGGRYLPWSPREDGVGVGFHVEPPLLLPGPG